MESVCDGVVDCLFKDDEFDCTEGELGLRIIILGRSIMMTFSDKIGRYSYDYGDVTDTVVYDTEYDQEEDGDEDDDWAFGLWK